MEAPLKLLGGRANRRRLGIILTIVCVLSVSSRILADDSKVVVAHATGVVNSQTFCSATEVCQEATVSGLATHIGALTGALAERVDITTGSYTGTGVFTTANGDTIETEYVGQVFPPDQFGTAVFIESHEVVGGTGKFAGATGDLQVVGTANPAWEISIDGQGTLSR